ncbi:MAG: hypothetical protein HY913_07450 [Desulfomonile tiedjei]|nr:hypothetical protein [Desulfomonile tiedjei]
MRQRFYYYIEGKLPQDPSQWKYIRREVECDDTFDGELIMVAFPIKTMKEISSVLSHFQLREDPEYFLSECKEMVSVPEKHVDQKGKGKIAFQSYFHTFPDSINSFFDDAVVIVILHPRVADNSIHRDYSIIGYIHVNRIEFKSPDGEVHKGYYYNMLRLSETTIDGEAIFRRKRIFTTLFNVLLDVAIVEDVSFTYASMGRENQAIKDALKMNSERIGRFFETFPVTINTHINLIFGSSGAGKRLVDISNDKEALHEYYLRIREIRGRYLFDQLHSEEKFSSMLDRILKSSPTSRVFMLPDEAGNMEAACLAINWGDYLHLKLKNPKGFFKMIDSIGIKDKILYVTLLAGKPSSARQLVKGVAYKFRKEHGVHVTLLTSHDGDPYIDVKKSIIHDPYVYMIIIKDRMDVYEAMRDHSKDENGNVRLFIDTPML